MFSMSPEEWERLDEVLDAALDLPPDDRDTFIERACGPDDPLGRRARAVLSIANHASDFLERPVGDWAGGLLREIAEEADGESAHISVESGLAEADRVGPYRLIRELGRGGMGAVYLAERDDERYERRVAIKLVRAGPLGREFRTRFLLEQRILASLEHPHIARLYDAGITDDGTPYLIMEYVAGRPVDVYCDEHRLTVRARLELFDQVCDAVQFAHHKLVVHRDLKPGNILVSRDGVVKLLDFGIAKLLRGEGDGGVTLTGLGGFRALTPEYASPEQLRGEPVTTATDVYALGVLLFKLLTGRWPYRPTGRRSVSVLERAVLEQDPERPSAAVARRPGAGTASGASPSSDGEVSETGALALARRSTSPGALRRRLRGDLDNIVLTALRKEPERRYASVQDLREDVRRHLENRPVSATSATWGYRAGRFVRRHRAGVAASMVVAGSLVAGLAGTAWQARATAREARRADQVREFLVSLFEVSDPDRSGGESVTARQLLDRGADRLDTELAAEPELRAEMLSVLGDIYQKLGLYDRARPLLEEALEVREARLGPGHLDVARSAADLASLLYDQGEYADAEALARNALAVRRELRGPEDTLVAASMTDLAAILNGQGKHAEAESLYREGLEIDRTLGARQAVASDLGSLSVALWRQGRYEEALPLAEEALTLRRDLHGDEHTLVAIDLQNLAAILTAMGEYDRAEELLRECLAMRRKLLGDGHPHVALTLSTLGGLLEDRGRLEEAERAHREALAIRRDAFGDGHLQVAESLNNLGVVRYFSDDPAGAAEHFEQALAIWRRELGETHPDVLAMLNNLGATRRALGDLDGAERALREALALRRETLGEDHPDVAQSLNNLADLLSRKGAYEEAEARYRAALAGWRSNLGEDHPTVAFALIGLGRMMLETDRCPEAEPLLREAVAIRADALEEDDVQLAATRLYLGECLTELESFAEAEPLLLASHEVLEERRGEDHELTRRARLALDQLYRTTGGRPGASDNSGSRHTAANDPV